MYMPISLIIILLVHVAVLRWQCRRSTTELRLTTFSPRAHYCLIGFLMMAELMYILY